jgi:hypothetical protein
VNEKEQLEKGAGGGGEKSIISALLWCRVARFFLVQTYQIRKNIPNDHKLYQMAINYTKYCKIFQMAIKYAKILHS